MGRLSSPSAHLASSQRGPIMRRRQQVVPRDQPVGARCIRARRDPNVWPNFASHCESLADPGLSGAWGQPVRVAFPAKSRHTTDPENSVAVRSLGAIPLSYL